MSLGIFLFAYGPYLVVLIMLYVERSFLVVLGNQRGSYPELNARPSPPIEGDPMTLTCETQLLPKKPDVQFCFFKDGHILSPGCNSNSELQINAVRKEDSGSYWCEVKTNEVSETKMSRRKQINVQRIPVNNVNLETRPPRGQVVEGEKLVLICSAAVGTGSITFSWYKGSLGFSLETKTQHSLTAEYEIPMMKESNAEQYYCAADNGGVPRVSGLVNITVRIPVTRPIFTFGHFWDQAKVGDMVELRCEVQRGSPPILYQFYHEGISLGSNSAPSGGPVSFNISLTAEHSGNFSCGADNGLGAQHSEVVILNVTVPMEDKGDPLPSGVIEGILGIIVIIVLTTVAVLFCCLFKRKIGRRPATDPLRSPSHPAIQDPTYLNSPDPEQSVPDYENANVANGNEIYSLVYQVQQEQHFDAVEPQRTHMEPKYPSAIYSRLKKKKNVIDVDYDDAM